jgi:hypothetical protein
LPTAERPLRLAEFDDLFAAAVCRVDPVDATHIRLYLTGLVGSAIRVRDPTVRETEYCWATVAATRTWSAGEVPVATPNGEARGRPHADRGRRELSVNRGPGGYVMLGMVRRFSSQQMDARRPPSRGVQAALGIC